MNDRKGFTLMEMLIVVAVIAILILIAIPVFSTHLEKARAATCQANLTSSMHILDTESMLEGSVQLNDPASVLRSGIGADDKGALANGKHLCPDDGEYTFKFTNALGLYSGSCSEHGGSISGATAMQTAAENLSDPTTGLGALLQTIRNGNSPIGAGSSIDYPLPASVDTDPRYDGWTRKLIAEAKKLGLDLASGSWKLYRWNGGDYSLYYTPEDVTKLPVGSSVTVTKWNFPSTGGTLQKLTGTAKVVNQTSYAGDVYPTLNAPSNTAGGFTPVTD